MQGTRFELAKRLTHKALNLAPLARIPELPCRNVHSDTPACEYYCLHTNALML